MPLTQSILQALGNQASGIADLQLHDTIRLYCENKPEISACYLFGSYASGKNRPGSDLDLAFLVHPELDEGQIDQLRSAVIIELGRLTRLDIHPLIMNTAGELVLGQIFAKGVCLYQRSDNELKRFRRQKLPMIAEFGYYVADMRAKLAGRYGGHR
ncbi:type VII toxin-antitoxin system MntA family adenylyltransferase antitoxin [Trichlorobacter sp.]|uniref:type VII toxin-antitoxin system MntA family adenylyltransferase antitoxin n=1 Tax=Trichlorobacter sp. TaxID=2911007 RepID=UPI002A368926|nr:nucleotidyltransferase domain-containing protein [Trichlorobacter sp.]MDY0383097.1 nucleotidyltransferase domain-containing protein [Trichlorobacter sp.]